MCTEDLTTDVLALQEEIKKFRDITIEMKKTIEKEDYDGIEILLNKRQEIIDLIMTLDYSNEDFAKFCDEYSILKLQEEVKNTMMLKRNKVRGEIEKLAASKNVSQNYNKKSAAEPVFFNKQI